MASILETFLILFETDAKKAEAETQDATKAAEKLAETLDKVGKVDTSKVENLDTALSEAYRTGEALGNVLRDMAGGDAQALNDIVAAVEAALGGATGKAGELRGGIGEARGQADVLRAALTDPVGDAAKSTKPLAEGLEQAADQAKNVNDNLPSPPVVNAVGDGFMGWARKLAAPIAGLLTVTSVIGLIRGQFTEIVELTEKASRYNFNVEGLNAFNQIVEDMGGNAADAERYVKRFADATAEAFSDAKSDPGKVFKELKISAADAKGNLKDMESVLLDLAGALEGMSRQAQLDKLRRLGIVDPAMVKLVLQGREAVEKLMAAEKAKGLVTAEGAAKVRALKMAWDDAKDAFLTVVNSLLGALAPALTTVAGAIEATLKWLTANKTFVEGFAIAMAIAGAVIMATFVPAIWAAAAGVIAATWPVLLLIAAVVALGLVFAAVYEDVKAFLSGQPSLIGELAAKYKWFADLITWLGQVFKATGEIAVAVFHGTIAALKNLWDAFWAFQKFLWDVWVGWAKLVASVMRTIWAIVGPVIRLIMDIVGALASIWVQHFNGMVATAKAVLAPLAPFISALFQVIMAALGGARDFFVGAFNLIAGAWGAMGEMIVAAWDATIGSIIGGVQRAVDWIRKLLGLRSDAEARGEKISADEKARAQGGGGKGGRPPVAPAVARGQTALGAASKAPLAAQSGGAVVASGRGAVTKTNVVKVGKVVVNTQATDADGMAKAADGALTAELKRTSSQFDDGVEA